MKRDDDYIRELLFKYEACEDWLMHTPGMTDGADEEEWRERYHVHLERVAIDVIQDSQIG